MKDNNQTATQVVELLAVWRQGGGSALQAHTIAPPSWEEVQRLVGPDCQGLPLGCNGGMARRDAAAPIPALPPNKVMALLEQAAAATSDQEAAGLLALMDSAPGLLTATAAARHFGASETPGGAAGGQQPSQEQRAVSAITRCGLLKRLHELQSLPTVDVSLLD